jgi:biopolymer transport protein ExbB/TolQ
MPSLSDKTEIGLPLKNLLSLLGVTATAVWAYFGIIERLNNIETRQTLFEADLVKAADQTPVDQEQFMLLEFVSGQVEGVVEDLENMAHNKVNIMRLQTDMEKALNDIESLKDKIRANGH